MSRSERIGDPAKLRLTIIGQPDKSIIVDALLIKSKSLPFMVSEARIIGNYSQNIKLMGFVGRIVSFSRISRKGKRSGDTGIARFEHSGWTSFSELKGPKVQIVGILHVLRYEHRLKRGIPEESFESHSYVYSPDVVDWPSLGLFGISYDGTIKRTSYKNGLSNLISCKDFSAVADKYYYYIDNGGELIRRQLASFSIRSKSNSFNARRAMQACRATLSFIYEVNLRPISYTNWDRKKYEEFYYPIDKVERVERDFHSCPIPISNQKRVARGLISWLYRSNLDLDQIEHVIERYVTSRREVPIEQSFSVGCEAIEGLFKILAPSYAKKGGQNLAIRELKNHFGSSGLPR